MVIHNWDCAVIEVAVANRGRPFKWGSTDCVTLTRRCLKTMLGVDPWAEVLPRYRTKKVALKAALDIDAVTAIESSGGLEVARAFATAGDVGIGPELDDHGLPAVAFLLPSRKALFSTAADGVLIVDHLTLPVGTRFFRYGE